MLPGLTYRSFAPMDFGVFIPIGNNGWMISKTSPQYMPSFELNKEIVQKAEGYGFEFVLSMVKLRGFGGETEFWDHNLESFNLMAGLAAVTEKIQLYASVATLTMNPAMTARMAMTIDDISGGRFGINLVSGWNKSEYEQMGVWPGDEYFDHRYDYTTEYVQIMKELWEKGQSDFKGEFFEMDDCRMLPLPKGDIKLVSAGQSPRGMQFTAEHLRSQLRHWRRRQVGGGRGQRTAARGSSRDRTRCWRLCALHRGHG